MRLRGCAGATKHVFHEGSEHKPVVQRHRHEGLLASLSSSLSSLQFLSSSQRRRHECLTSGLLLLLALAACCLSHSHTLTAHTTTLARAKMLCSSRLSASGCPNGPNRPFEQRHRGFLLPSKNQTNLPLACSPLLSPPCFLSEVT